MNHKRPAVGIALIAIALAASGCASIANATSLPVKSTVSPAHPIKPAIPSQWALAHLRAENLIATAILPADAVWVKGTPASAPTSPSGEITCSPLVDVTRYAIVSNVSLATTEDEAIAAAGSHSTGSGYAGDPDGITQRSVDEKTTIPNSELELTLAAQSDGDVVVRVDAVVGEANATCVNPGGPERTSSSKP